MATKLNLILLDGLSYMEQAELAHDCVKRSGRAFVCQPCAAASEDAHTAEEPQSGVVAVLVGEKGEMMPMCEECYERLVEEAHEFHWSNGITHTEKG